MSNIDNVNTEWKHTGGQTIAHVEYIFEEMNGMLSFHAHEETTNDDHQHEIYDGIIKLQQYVIVFMLVADGYEIMANLAKT